MSYFSAPGVNWSSLSAMRESPLFYKHMASAGRKDTSALSIGRLVHILVFEPDTIKDRYAIWGGGRRQGKGWDSFKVENSGLEIVKPEELAMATDMANAVRSHSLVAQYLNGGEFEVPLFWENELTGMRCKGRPDWIHRETRTLIDIKTCRSIESKRFGAEAARYGYHCQMAHYCEGIQASLGFFPKEILLVAVEKEAPYDVGVFVVSDDDLWAAREELSILLERLANCEKADYWPGRYLEKQALQLPAWVFDAEDDDTFGLQIEG